MTDYIAVLSGKGGTGKTTVSVALAKALEGGLLDIDLMGPNVPETLKEPSPSKPMMRGGRYSIEPAIQDGMEVVSLSYDLLGDTVMMRDDNFEREIVSEWINNVDWDSDIVVTDTPPGTDSPTREILKDLPKPYAIMVTTGQKSSIQDCKRTMNMVKHLNEHEGANIQILGIIENFSYYSKPRWLGEALDYVKAEKPDLIPGNTALPLLGKNHIGDEFEGVPILAEVPFAHTWEERQKYVSKAIDVLEDETAIDLIDYFLSLEPDGKEYDIGTVEGEEESDEENNSERRLTKEMLTDVSYIGESRVEDIEEQYLTVEELILEDDQSVMDKTGIPKRAAKNLMSKVNEYVETGEWGDNDE